MNHPTNHPTQKAPQSSAGARTRKSLQGLLPSVISLVVLISIFTAVYLTYFWLRFCYGDGAVPLLSSFATTLGFAYAFISFLYGILRVAYCHPAWDEDYRNWLATTPWKPGLPTPYGDSMIELRDLVFLLIAMLLSWQAPFAVLLTIPLAFGIGHAAAVAVTLKVTDIKVPFYILLNCSLLFLWLFPNLYAMLGLLLLLELVKRSGNRECLEQFPWPQIKKLPTQAKPGKDNKEEKLSWHYEALDPNPKFTAIPRWEAIVISLFSAAFVVTIMDVVPRTLGIPTNNPEWLTIQRNVTMFTGGALGVLRLFRYKANFRSPISWPGRLFTGRLLLPRHDYVYWVPVLLLGIGLFGGAVLSVSPTVIQFATTAVCMYAFITGRPTMSEWSLASQVRIGNQVGSSQ